jgi:hypothetical protein
VPKAQKPSIEIPPAAGAEPGGATAGDAEAHSQHTHSEEFSSTASSTSDSEEGDQEEEMDVLIAAVDFVTKVSFFYFPYIFRESCSQFDSLPLTSLKFRDEARRRLRSAHAPARGRYRARGRARGRTRLG